MIDGMEDSPRFPQLGDLSRNLTQIEFVCFLGWNVADGHWGRLGLDETAGGLLLLDLFSKLHGGGRLEMVNESSGRLQQRLMSLRRGSFEEIQQEAPFSRHAQRNMKSLLRAWEENGEAGFARVWELVFRMGGEAAREPQEPIRIIGEGGDCQERALEVLGAPDWETRVAAEWFSSVQKAHEIAAWSLNILTAPAIESRPREDCVKRNETQAADRSPMTSSLQ